MNITLWLMRNILFLTFLIGACELLQTVLRKTRNVVNKLYLFYDKGYQ